MKRRQNRQEKADLPSTKYRRLVLKQERATVQGANEVLEGDTYQPGIGHVDSVDVVKIPDAISRPIFKPVEVTGEATFIAFDLETTGLIVERRIPHITQIAASELTSGSKFNVYVTPKVPINPESSAVTGITIVDGEMRVNGNPVQSISATSAIEKMISWLEKFNNVCLVAHNGRRFDFPVLMSALKSTGSVAHFPVSAFIDSLSVFRKLYPKQSLKQVDLVSSLLGETYDAHNAMADVMALGQLLKVTKLSQKDLMVHSFLPSAVANNMLYNDAKAENRKTLNPLIYSGVCKQPTADNIAGSGLNLDHIRMVFRRGGEDGLRDVFTAKNSDGLPRVTNSKKVLEEVIPKLVKYIETH